MEPATVHGALSDLPLWAQTAGLVVGALVAAKVIDVVAERLVREFVRETETDLDETLYDHLHLPVVLTIALAGVLLAESVLPEELRAAVGPYVGNPTLTLLVVVWVFTLNRLGDDLLDRAGERDVAYASFVPVFSNLLTFAILLGGLFAVLSIWKIDVTPLLASAGIAGVAVGFAARDTVANFFGGLSLYFDRTYRVGDFIELESGEEGTVVEVGIRSTTFMTRDEVMVTVPNSVLNNARIVNKSAPKRRKRIRVPFGVAYGSDVEEVERIALDVAEGEDLVLDSPRPQARFLALGDSALQYELQCYIATPGREPKVRHRLNRALYRRLTEAGIEIPYPKREVKVADQATDEQPPEAAGVDD